MIWVETPVLSSLRQLAATARSARAIDPLTTAPQAEAPLAHRPTSQPSDPLADAVVIANTRLFKAIQTVTGHVLILSINERMSEDNAIRLRTEIAEHDVQLDSLDARVKEAGYRLTLGDLKAFHSSGVNDADIQTAQTVVEGGLLTWIGAKQ
jgi:hypothetical protein